MSRAAESLRLTPSAVSQQMAKLEKAVGQRLTEPAGRSIRLTPLGEQLAAHADAILAMVERAEADVQAGADAITGTLVVASFATAARALLGPAVGALAGDVPGLAVRVREMEPTEALPLLERGQVDMAIVDTWADLPLAIPDRLSSERLLDDVADVLLPADHTLAARPVVALSEMPPDQVWISWPDGSNCHRWLSHRLGARQLSDAHSAMEHATQIALIAAGLGAAIVPRLGRGPLPPPVRCVALDPAPVRTVHAVWRDGASRRPAIRAVLAELRRQAGCTQR